MTFEASPLDLPLDRLKEFPVMHEWVYLNHAGVAPLPARVAQAARDFVDEASRQGVVDYPSWMKRAEAARAAAARLMGCEALEVAFVKNTTHGLLCVANSLDWREGDNLVSFESEFPANVWPWKNLERLGVERRLAPLRDGVPALEDLEALIDSRTRLVAASFVGYANGYRIDGARLGELCKRRGALCCLDGIQGLGAVPVAVNDWGVDFLAADGHKWLLAPEGIGVLFCSKSVIDQLNPSMTGWTGRVGYSDYEHNKDKPLLPDARRFEEGSWNMLGIHALGSSLDLFHEVGMKRISASLRAVTDYLVDGLKRRGWNVLSHREDDCWSGIVMAAKEGADHGAIYKALLERNIFAAARAGKLRFSPHYYNTPEEMDRTLKALEEIA